jgi:O-antigen biosynthesis protein
MTVSLPRAEQPELSVVMVTYGGWELTRRSLETLARNTSVPFEVVIVDNPTEDEDVAGRLRSEVEGAEIIFNQRNVGFGPAANQGAEAASGRSLCFLNSDAMVHPGSVQPLLEAIEEDPRAGAAVPMFLNEDGTVQEAGGLLFEDGRTLMYGFGDDPSDPAYRFRRYVDYGSAACLVLRTEDFHKAGGFDPVFVPAYCEDVDLQLKLRERGLRTVYQPRSQVVHVRFGSTGLDEQVARQLVARNTRILRERWAPVLADRPVLDVADEFSHRVVAARDFDCLERFLVVSPRPHQDLLDSLLEAHPTARITQLCTEPAQTEAFLRSGVEAVGPLEDPASWLRDRLFQATVVLLPDGAMDEELAAAIESTQPQALTITGPQDPATEMEGAGIVPEETFRASES